MNWEAREQAVPWARLSLHVCFRQGWKAGVSVAISGADTHVRRTQVICPYPNPPRGFGVSQVRGTLKKKKKKNIQFVKPKDLKSKCSLLVYN